MLKEFSSIISIYSYLSPFIVRPSSIRTWSITTFINYWFGRRLTIRIIDNHCLIIFNTSLNTSMIENTFAGSTSRRTFGPCYFPTRMIYLNFCSKCLNGNSKYIFLLNFAMWIAMFEFDFWFFRRKAIGWRNYFFVVRLDANCCPESVWKFVLFNESESLF